MYGDMGGFHYGDRVRIKPKYTGKTALSIAKRSGEWILKEFKTKNWVLKRPADYTGSYKQGLLAKSHMLEKVEPSSLAEKSIAAAKNKPTDLGWAMTGADMPPTIKQANDIKKDVIVYRPGMVCLVKHPDYPGQFKGLHAIIEHGNSDLNWIAVAPLFGGPAATVKTTYVTVIPQKDLTITYLPQ